MNIFKIIKNLLEAMNKNPPQPLAQFSNIQEFDYCFIEVSESCPDTGMPCCLAIALIWLSKSLMFFIFNIEANCDRSSRSS